MEGRGAEALEASRQVGETMPKDIVCGMPGADFFLSAPIFVMVRFGRFQELLAEPKPDAKYPVLSALWHHGQGMALAATGKADEARPHAQAIGEIAASVPDDVLAGLNSGRQVLELAQKVLQARIAEADKADNAIALWQEAVAIEDQLAYNEPADWFYPVRHYLGAALLEASKPKEAEAVYRADLERNPKNGWALFGLWKSLEAQKRTKDAKAAQKTFKTAWANADIELTRTAF
jgi:tetratricopeptide (TPR) repeat protein